jgi:hypothetical protein
MLTGGNMSVPERLFSDLVLVDLDGTGRMAGVRDPYAVDKKKPAEARAARHGRAPHATLASWTAVQGFAREHAIYLQINGVVWFSDPTLALAFVTAPNQPRMIYKVEGSKTINGVQVFSLGFKERNGRWRLCAGHAGQGPRLRPRLDRSGDRRRA